MRVFERGWLSANNILLDDGCRTHLIDSGYCVHATQTVALVENALGFKRPLNFLLNTHLHSDHCGGNAALKVRYPNLITVIPPGQADSVSIWDRNALSHQPTGQMCPRFTFDELLQPHSTVESGKHKWQVHSAGGHDPHSVILFEAEEKILISADALWEKGFGVVFPELEGVHAFSDVEKTLNLIEKLTPDIVIPGHGPVFQYQRLHMKTARHRLEGFVKNPSKHANYAAKVLIKFKLIEWQKISIEYLMQWAMNTSHLLTIHKGFFEKSVFKEWLSELLSELERSKAASIQRGEIVNL